MLFRASEATDGTSDFATQALQYLNRAYHLLCQGGSALDPSVREDWWWLRAPSPGVLTLEPQTTNTATATTGSTSVTLGAAPAASVAGYIFFVDGHPDMFRVATHTGGSPSLTLDGGYTGVDVVGAACTLRKVAYPLASDVLRPIAPMRVYRHTGLQLRDYKIDGVDLNTMDEYYPLPWLEAGIPDLFAPIGEFTVRFNRYGLSTPVRIEYEYLKRPAALANTLNEEPLVPLERRSMLSDFATGLLMVDKDDTRATGILEFARRNLLSMALENRNRWSRMSDHMLRIHPRDHNRQRYGPIRTEAGLIIG